MALHGALLSVLTAHALATIISDQHSIFVRGAGTADVRSAGPVVSVSQGAKTIVSGHFGFAAR